MKFDKLKFGDMVTVHSTAGELDGCNGIVAGIYDDVEYPYIYIIDFKTSIKPLPVKDIKQYCACIPIVCLHYNGEQQ